MAGRFGIKRNLTFEALWAKISPPALCAAERDAILSPPLVLTGGGS